MALPTVNDLKSYLRIETDAEDTLIAALLARATAMLELWIDTPVTAESQTAVDRVENDSGKACTSLIFPRRPIGPTATVVDADGVTVSAATYTVDQTAGILWAKPGAWFSNGPYTITTLVGLSNYPRYAALEPVVASCIIDLAADLYQRRTPGAQTETGAASSITWDVSRETVARVQKAMRGLKLPVML